MVKSGDILILVYLIIGIRKKSSVIKGHFKGKQFDLQMMIYASYKRKKIEYDSVPLAHFTQN